MSFLEDNLNQKFPFISQDFTLHHVSAAELDQWLAKGWRHFGTYFFCYSFSFLNGQPAIVVPLRIRLADYRPSRSQRKIWLKNAHLQTVIRPIVLDQAKHDLFVKHKERFVQNIPQDLYTFLSPTHPDTRPCKAVAVEVYDGNRLVACSFLDLGQISVSSIYGMFDPDYEKLSLGIYTMLLEIDFAVRNGKAFYYHGYSYNQPSHYDYKKKFAGLQKYDWQGNWAAHSPYEAEAGQLP
jgi:arginine-tRNA-protein transferase